MTRRRLRSTSRTRRTIACAYVAVSLAALSAAGCCLRRQAPSILAKHAPLILGAQCSHMSTQEEVFVGLYSIYYRAAYLSDNGHQLGDWAPAPLVTAAGYLRCDPHAIRPRSPVR